MSNALNNFLYVGHRKNYWLKDKNRIFFEMFANMSSINTLNSKGKPEFKRLLKEIYKAYRELIT